MALKNLQLWFESSLLGDGRLRGVSKELVAMALKCEGLPLACCLEKLLLSTVIMEFGNYITRSAAVSSQDVRSEWMGRVPEIGL